MVRFLLSGVALAGLAACQSTIPDDVVYSPAAQTSRDSALSAPVVSAPTPVAETPLATTGGDPALQPLPSSVTAAVSGDAASAQQENTAAAQAAAANSGVAPIEASPSNPPPVIVNEVGISNEQDFEAVSAQRSIASDAELIASNRAQYTVIDPTELPTRPGSNQPNIVEYALRTDNPVGTQLYRRSGLRAQRAAAACRKFASPDLAQAEFLSSGGPERDRRGLDPDGDGYACTWDPRPFRNARGATQTAAAPVTQSQAQPQTQTQSQAQTVTQNASAASSPVVEPLAISTE
ncbi:hypothetical protein [Aliishimia ponticola]|uniref:hypothetical protein n=1 Tax=Aliishimia ponticola TaxID=2499833 RepID=UPI001B3B8FB1|nr:hypothetical protein [Aliishimia ponticola]